MAYQRKPCCPCYLYGSLPLVEKKDDLSKEEIYPVRIHVLLSLDNVLLWQEITVIFFDN